MILDAEQRQDGWFQNFDVCICGAGPAGITLARHMAEKGWRVALLEAGGLESSLESQEFYKGESVGLPYTPLDLARLRFFGGTSNHWSGYSRPLDVRDFEPLAFRPSIAWPIRATDLDTYRDATNAIIELPEASRHIAVLDGTEKEIANNPYRVSKLNFGTRYREELEKSEKITVFLNANLVDIELDEGLRSVKSAVFRSYHRDDTFEVKCRFYVLCLGGLENPRALLNANRQMPLGIGNEHDVVGRYFAEHPNGVIGGAILNDPPTQPLIYVASSQLMQAEKSLSFQVSLDPIKEHASRLRRYADEALCTTWLTRKIGESLLSRAPVCHNAAVSFMTEQAPNPESRVRLTDEKDRFGLRRMALDWELLPLDYHTIRVAALALGRWLAEQNLGRLQIVPWLREPGSEPAKGDIDHSFHHMCTTRMGDDPKLSVVDKDCRVHGIENLFIGGSSVFSTSGLSNPTYTIVQLALRLGDHLGSMS